MDVGIEATIVVLSSEPDVEMLICDDDDPTPVGRDPDTDTMIDGLGTGVETGAEGV